MKPLIVTGCTPDYQEHADRLRLQASSFGHDCLVVPYEDRGSWMRNIRGKAECLARAREMFDRPLLWVDADSTMLKPINDLEVVKWHIQYDFVGPHVRNNRPRRYYVGCMFFNNTEGGLRLLTRWRQLCDGDIKDPGESDEHWLEFARLEMEQDLRWGELPKEYAWLPRDREPTDSVVFVMGLSGKASKHAPPVKKIEMP